MSKLTYTMIAGAVAALVGSAALAIQQAQAQQGATGAQGTGAGPAAQQNYDLNYMDQAQWMRQRAMEQYALEKQTCNTLRHQSPKEEAYEGCLQQAEAARHRGAGSGSTSLGSQAQEGQAQQGSGQDTGVLDKMKKAVTNTLAEIGIGSGSKTDAGQQGQGGIGPGGQGFGQGQGNSGQQEQQGFAQGQGGIGPGGQGFGQGQGSSGQQQGFAQGQWGGQPQQGYNTQGSTQQGATGGQGFGQGQGSSGQQQGFAQGQWSGQPQQGSTRQDATGGQGSAKDQGGADQIRWNADPTLTEGGLTESEQYLVQHGVINPTAYALELGNREYAIYHQFCKTLQYQNPQAYEQCEQQAQTAASTVVKAAVAAIAGS